MTTGSISGKSLEPIGGKVELKAQAAELEGLFLAQVLEKFRESCRWPGEEPSDNALESFGALATSAVAEGVARTGGLGLGALLLRSLEHSGAKNPVIGNSVLKD